MKLSNTLLQRLANARLVVVFTGAGVSAESGISTFRSPDGLWAKFSPQELANVDAFLRNPQLVWAWYQARRQAMMEAQPNAGHRAIAMLETLVPKVVVITQNIDGLHARAGSTDVIELHGSALRNFCIQCRRHYDGPEFLTREEVPQCQCGGFIRPDVVWFGEMLPVQAVERAWDLATQANVLFSIGTSSLVWPAAELPFVALEHGGYVVEINTEETPLTPKAHEHLPFPSGIVMPKIVEMMKEEG
ncbi:MAG: NAD-dependent deacylase [Chlorobi bacterium CHB2]|nr:NAD-dependent deacylase [Chlorobi bacterium CHB2]